MKWMKTVAEVFEIFSPALVILFACAAYLIPAANEKNTAIPAKKNEVQIKKKNRSETETTFSPADLITNF